MRKRTSDYYSSDTEQIARSEGNVGLSGAVGGSMMMEGDVFVLRPSQYGDRTGEYQEAKRAYDNGPDEVRQLLLYECNLIYECKMCRNMFRSLAQFISHKRVYCCDLVGNGGANDKDNGRENYNGFTVNQAPMVQKQNDNMSETKPEGDHHMDNGFKKRKKNSELNLQHENVVNNNAQQKSVEAAQLSDSTNLKTEWVNNTIVMDNAQPTESVIIPSVVVVADEQNINFKEHQKGNEAGRINGHLLCKMCKGVFQTAKQLKQHLQKKHLSSYVFKCPNCTLTFMHPTEVIRHLAVEHKKSGHRIGRELILKTRVSSGHEDEKQQQQPQQQKIVNNRELKRLQSSPDVVGSMGAGGISSDGTAPKKIISVCHYCGKSFERRAALSTHLLHCRVKQASREKLFMSTTNGVPSMNKRMKLQAAAYADNTTVIKTEKSSEDTDLDTEQLNEMFANLGKQTFGTGLRTVSLDQLDLDRAPQEEKEKQSTKENTESIDNKFENQNIPLVNTLSPSVIMENMPSAADTESVVKVEMPAPDAVLPAGEIKKRRRFRIVHAEKRLSCRCKICGKQFNALSNLRRHISMFHYRSERFGCTLCDYRAFRRYDIVNHLGYVHKMKGEREAMSTEYVSVHEVNYSKDDVESDIVLLNDELEAASFTDAQLGQAKSLEKRVRRRKMISNGDGVGVGTKITRQKLKRSSSLLESGNGKVLQKRPIRNRIKPVNKDFVYDLSDLLRKEGGAADGNNVAVGEIECRLKRRNTLYNADSGLEMAKHNESLITSACLDSIKGAAQRLTLSLVGQGLAASATQPELPSERPQMRSRLISTNRADMQPVAVIETSELEAARLKSTLLDDTFLEKVSKRSAPGFKIKPCLALQHSTLSWLLEKVDSSLHNGAAKKMSNEALTTNQFNQVSPPPSIPKATSPPPTPRKRITLLERLTENKIKYQESVALGSGKLN